MNQEKLDLKRLIDKSDCVNNTDKIRSLKHSQLIFNDMKKFMDLKLKKIFSEDILKKECSFLYSNYTDIFYKMINDELNFVLMEKLLNALKQIEDGVCDQHEASVIVGKLLKEIYVDSALAKAEKLDKQHEKHYKESKKITYKEFKKMS